TFKKAIPVNGLSYILILAALVACTGKTGDSSTQTPTLTSSFLSDALVHVPPTAGLYAYNTFTPGSAGFPAVGGVYKDPIFGGVIRRLTNTVDKPNKEDIYGHHWANANGTFAFSRQSTGVGTTTLHIINTITGVKVYTDQPLGSVAFDIAWDAIDPNKYYYYTGNFLVRRNLADLPVPIDTPMKDFGTPLEANGGSLNTQDRSGRYFTVRYGGSNKVWDSQTDIIYSGSVTPLNLNGWVAITPDGNYLVTAAGPTALPHKEHYSYFIDHIAQSISPTPVNFWGLCGDHGVLASTTEGKNYFITFDCNSIPGIWRVDITLDQAGKTETEQHDANLLLLPLAFGTATTVSTNDGHLSAVSKEGPNQNWVFFDSETFSGYDPFDFPPTDWQPYEQEIIAMNVNTLEVRRYAHHRSRGLSSSYYAQPRISCSWDGSIILWTSNYNTSSPTGYADLYGMAFSGN
ncbi:MAG: hypothetical protein AAB177_08200, partial [Nitrospirota bacterium]